MNYWEQSENSNQNLAWHNKRRLGLGGSEIAIVMGKSPYRTPYSLWLEKTGRKSPDNISGLPHVQRGIAGEKACRMLLERKYLVSFTPKSWELGEICRCNDDGYSLDRNWILEIKCMGKKAHDEARDGVIPEHYRLQCQWNLMVSGADKCIFVSYQPETEEIIEIDVHPDIEEQKQLKAAAERWWEVHVVRDMAPALSSKDYVPCDLESFAAAAHRYRQTKTEVDRLQEELKTLHKELESFVTEDIPALRGSGVRVSRRVKLGAIDYRKVPALGVDLEQYRKPSVTYTMISIEGEEDNETTK